MLVALQFLATGGFCITIGDMFGIHASTVSRIIEAVLDALIARHRHHVKMPHTVAEVSATKLWFCLKAGIKSNNA